MSNQSPEKISKAHEEWAYEEFEGEWGNEQSVVIPCQLRFVDTPNQNTDRFHEALKENGYRHTDKRPAENYEGDHPQYRGKVMIEERYNRVRVLVFRENLVRLYPLDKEDIPSTEELGNLIAAIEEGFGAELEHYSIEEYEEDND